MGDLTSAKASSQRAIELNPLSAEAHNNLGVALKEMGSHEHALHIFQKAIDLQADNANAHNNLGNVLKQMGKLDRALTAIRKLLKSNLFEDV